MKTLGYIAYEGPSLIDGAPIVVIVNKIDDGSDNAKTGAIVQSFIIRADVVIADHAVGHKRRVIAIAAA
jgi:hypothetical protein